MPIRFEMQNTFSMGTDAHGKFVVSTPEKRTAKEINLQFVGLVGGVDPKFNFFLHKETILHLEEQTIEFHSEFPFEWKIPFERPSTVLEWPSIIWALAVQVKWADFEYEEKNELNILRLDYAKKPQIVSSEIVNQLTEERRKATKWNEWDKKDLDRTFAFVAIILFFIFGSHFVCRPEGMNLGFQALGISVTLLFSLCIGLIFVTIRRWKRAFENLILFWNGFSTGKDVEIFALPGSNIQWKMPSESSWSLCYERRIIEFHMGTHRGDHKKMEDRRSVLVEIQSGSVGSKEEEVILQFDEDLPSQIFIPHRHLYYSLKIIWKIKPLRGIFWKITREIPIVFGYWKDQS